MKSLGRAAGATLLYELKRSLRWPRGGWWAALALFAPLCLKVLTAQKGGAFSAPAGDASLFYVGTLLLCPLGLLLNASSAVASELESKNWTYIAVRPEGKSALLLGKYGAAVVWTVTAAWTGLLLTLIWIRTEQPVHLGAVLAGLSLLSALSYGALFLLLGVLAVRKAMVVTVGYMLGLEYFLASLPTAASKLTIAYRLNQLYVLAFPLPATPHAEHGLPPPLPAWEHVLVLGAASILLLLAAVLILRQRELVTSEEK